MSLVVYADFSCPECYLAARRADVLSAAGVDVQWRAVEREPRLPVGGRPLGAAGEAELAQRFRALDALLLPGEMLPWTPPRVLARTEAAVTAFAEAAGAGVGDEVRRLLCELYWQRGADIGNPAVLRAPLAGAILRGHSTAEALNHSGFAVGVTGGPITTGAFERIRQWRAQWRQLGSPALPVVLTDSAVLSGLDALRRLGKEIDYVGASVDSAPPAATAFPAVQAHPGPRWASRVGDPWCLAHRIAAL